jgi:hypothetical protein
MRNTVSRHPLLSADLVDFVLRLPPDGSIGDLSRPDLRRATSGILPDDVRLRRHKRHFTAVIGLSLRADLPVVHELLSDPHARVRSLVRPDAIERLMNARPDRWGALTAWTVQILPVLMVECWLRALEDGAFAENMLADERLAQTQIRFVESAARG